MSEYLIGEGMQVTLHFAIKLTDQTQVDSTFDKSPATFNVGDGNLLPGFEQALFGLKSGDKEVLQIEPAQGFGMRNPNNVQRLPKSQFDQTLELQPGLMLSFADANKSELPGVISAIEDEEVEVDFNHPLAGQDLLFEVEILEVKPQG